MTILSHSTRRARKTNLIFDGWPPVCRWQRGGQVDFQAVSRRSLLLGALSFISPGWVLSFYFGYIVGSRFHSLLGCRELSRTTSVRPPYGGRGIPVPHNVHLVLVENLMIARRVGIMVGFWRCFVESLALCFSARVTHQSPFAPRPAIQICSGNSIISPDH